MLTTHKEDLKRVQAAIVDGHRRGVCDRDGNSVSVGGVMTAKPYGGRVTFRKVYPRYEKTGE